MDEPSYAHQLSSTPYGSQILSHGESPFAYNPRNPETILNQRNPSSINRRMVPIPFKTEQCLKFKRGNCNYGHSCRFAHGNVDTRNLQAHSHGVVGKREEDRCIINSLNLCRKFCNGEQCPYGSRCHFLHEGIEKGRGDFGLSRQSFVVNTMIPESGGDGRFGACKLEDKRVENLNMNANQVPQKPAQWKTRSCMKWEKFGNCPYGERCYFAHGQAELQKLGVHTASKSENVCASKPRTSPPVKDASSSKTEIETGYKQHLRVRKCLHKWRVEKVGRIYADWIDYLPVVHTSLGQVEG